MLFVVVMCGFGDPDPGHSLLEIPPSLVHFPPNLERVLLALAAVSDTSALWYRFFNGCREFAPPGLIPQQRRITPPLAGDYTKIFSLLLPLLLPPLLLSAKNIFVDRGSRTSP